MPFTSLIKVALGPLFFLQGRHVRKTALRMPEADGERRGYIRHDASAEPLNLLFVGDSTMAGVGVEHQDAALGALTAREVSTLLCRPVHWQVIARSGLKVSQILPLTDQEDLAHANVLITAMGANDVLAQTTPCSFVEGYERLIAKLLPADRAGITVISGLPPLHATPAIPQPLRWFFGLYANKLDRALQEWIRGSPGTSYLSLQWAADRTKLAADRFHPGEGLYREWAHRIARQIADDLGGTGIPQDEDGETPFRGLTKTTIETTISR